MPGHARHSRAAFVTNVVYIQVWIKKKGGNIHPVLRNVI